MKEITFVTSNASKAEQLSHHLNYQVSHKKLDLAEIQSLDLKQVVERKAREAYGLTGKTVLVEDTSLIFVSLGKLPGPLVKWFLSELGTEGMCQILDRYPNRNAIAQVSFCLYDGKNTEIFNGRIHGTISNFPKGESGFGWDSIFVPNGSLKTWGEMSPEEQAKTSMRRIALKKLERFLKQK